MNKIYGNYEKKKIKAILYKKFKDQIFNETWDNIVIVNDFECNI